MFVRRLAVGAMVIAFAGAACSAAPPPATSAPGASVVPSAGSTTEPSPSAPTEASPEVADRYDLGGFPAFPAGSLSASTVAALQTVLDLVVEGGGPATFPGVTAAVIVADEGSWTGAAGSWDGLPLTTDQRHPTHSAAKTIVSAQVLRLAEDGLLDLDDPAADHLPPELAFFDANGATIRQVLAMRSGIPTVKGDQYYLAELASTVEEVFEMLPDPVLSPDVVTEYAGPNYVLLGAIIEHLTGQPLAETLRSGVLANPALDGLVYTVDDALASDGWGVQTTSAALARWGWELYGGSVLSDASLQEVTDFQGQWYGLGIMDLASEYGGARAIGHQGLSSVLGCCSAVVFVAWPAEGLAIAVQADTTGTSNDVANTLVDRVAGALRDVVRE
jgi:CubicO group peptidase (beta-lactamase class C family)